MKARSEVFPTNKFPKRGIEKKMFTLDKMPNTEEKYIFDALWEPDFEFFHQHAICRRSQTERR